MLNFDADHGFSRACPSGNIMSEERFWPTCQRCGCKMTHDAEFCDSCIGKLEARQDLLEDDNER